MSNYRGAVHFNKAIELGPQNSVVYYNVGCGYSIMNDSANACRNLKKAIELGYAKWDVIEKDNDLDNVRHAACFKELNVNSR